MKKILKNLNATLLALMMICSFCAQSYAIKYIDGRFITNTKVHKFVKSLIEQHEDYKEVSGEYKIRFDRIAFSFAFDRQNNVVKEIELFIPVVDQDEAIIFYADLYPKKTISVLELVNLFIGGSEFHEQYFKFEISDSTTIEDWYGDTVNQYDDMFSLITDITEENWREKCLLNPDIIEDSAPHSLLFFEIRTGEKIFVEGYAKDYDE